MAALVLPLAGCGGSDAGKLGPGQAKGLEKLLADAQGAIEDDDCRQAQEAAVAGQKKATGMQGVDAELQDNLVEGFRHLSERITSECDKPEKTPTPTATETETAVPTETATVEPTDTPVPTSTPTTAPTETATPFLTAVPTTGGAEPPDSP